MLVSSVAYSQIKKSEDQLLKYMSDNKDYYFEKKGYSTDGLAYLTYKCNTGKALTETFYLRGDSCILVTFLIANDRMSATIKDLGIFRSVGHNKWVDKEKTIVLSLVMFSNEPIFAVNIEPYDVYDPIGIMD